MKKFNKKEIFRNVGSSWFALGVNVLVGLFLSPFILHRLGDEAFGLWVLIFSVTGYYGLFDLGIRSSIIRYVSKYTAVDDHQQLNGLVNTALFSYSAVGLVCLAITAVGAFYVDSIFKVPATFLGTARLLFLMVGTSVSLGFPLGVFGGILEGLQRFYLLNTTSLASTLCRAALIVVALRNGSGLLMVAFITVALPLLTGIINGAIVLHLLPLKFGSSYVDRSSLRKIANYSGATFMIIVAGRLRFKTDAMVIGTFLSSAAITYFAIGSRLVDYATEVVSSLAQIFVPMSSQLEATGDMSQLRKLFIAGNRACALIIFPMAAVLVVLGKSVIEAWVGLKYVETSYPVLIILLVPSTLMLAQAASGRILFGISRHKVWAWVVLAEGIANLVLSITLVRRFGIIGDALGTAIPLACSMLFFLPHYLCRLLGIKLWVYLKEAFVLPIALCIPLIGILVGMQRWSYAHNYLHLAINMAAGLGIYGLGLLWAIRTRRIWNVGEIAAKAEPEEVALSLIETYQHEEA
ncbi:MAG TPA: oligosaccharide flippase family protein [Terriglobales bacterium]|nr:oligosaccharide flippase family protein [Terriglobales bacterium]